MNFGEILDRAWRKLGDLKGPDVKKHWPVAEMAQYATNVEKVIAKHLLCLNETDTIGYIVLSGTAGQITSVTVSSVVITSGAVSYVTSQATAALNLAATAAALAANIRAYASTPNYRAISRNDMVIIKAVPGATYPASGYTVSSVAAGGMTATCTDLTGLCRIPVAIGDQYFPLHEKVIEIKKARLETLKVNLSGLTQDQMDAYNSDWRSNTSGQPVYLMPDYDGKEVVLERPSSTADMINMEVKREPLFSFTADDLDQVPEIPLEYHEFMVHGMISEALLKRDTEVFDLAESEKQKAVFMDRIEYAKRERIAKSLEPKTNSIHPGLL